MDTSVRAVLAGWIGGMTIHWNECQSVIFMMFNRALGNKMILEAKAIFFTLRSDGTQREVTQALLQVALHNHADLLARVTSAISDFAKIAGRRNDFIHAIWHFPENAEPAEVWLGVRKNLNGKDPVEEAKKLINDLEAMFARLFGLKLEVDRALEPPRNALAGLLSIPPQQQAEQTSSSALTPKTDEPEVPPPQHPASEK